MAILALAAVGFTVGAVLLFANASHAKSPSGARAGGVILAVGAVVMLALFIWVWWRTHPREAGYLNLRVEPVELHRGDPVTATLVIGNPEKCGDTVELGLVCTEFYDEKNEVVTENGTQTQRVTRKIDAFSDWNTADISQLQQTLRFTVPPDAPFSYEGSAVTWAWHVSVVDRHPHRPDGRRDVPIWVTP